MGNKDNMFLKFIQDLKENKDDIDIEIYNAVKKHLFYITKRNDYSTILNVIFDNNYDDEDIYGLINEFLFGFLKNKLEFIISKCSTEIQIKNFIKITFYRYLISQNRNTEAFKLYKRIQSILEEKCENKGNEYFLCTVKKNIVNPHITRRGEKQTFSKESVDKYIEYLLSNFYRDGKISIKDILDKLNNDYNIYTKTISFEINEDSDDETNKKTINTEENVRSKEKDPKEVYLINRGVELFLRKLNEDHIFIICTFIYSENDFTKRVMEKYSCSLGTVTNKKNEIFEKIRIISKENAITQEQIFEILKKICIIYNQEDKEDKK